MLYKVTDIDQFYININGIDLFGNLADVHEKNSPF
jgi:hypothetical protein